MLHYLINRNYDTLLLFSEQFQCSNMNIGTVLYVTHAVQSTTCYHVYTSTIYATTPLTRLLFCSANAACIYIHCENCYTANRYCINRLQRALPFHMTGVPAIRDAIRDLAPAAAVADYEVPTYIIGVDSESGEMFIELQHQKPEEHRAKVQQLEAGASCRSSSKAAKKSSAASDANGSSGNGAKTTANNGLLQR
jgi:hypothetical protein